ncbi:MAG: SPOR domain-containing protein [Treponema sp.]|jgi:DedD protein|nr:SPOR domain-containing protein [Treponema sp.]
MEKKKLLLVAVSVGVFLVIIISASILIFTPKTPAGGTAVSSARPVVMPGLPGTAGTASRAGGEVSGTESGAAGTAPVTAPGTAGGAAADTERARSPASIDAADLVRNSQDLQGIQSPPSATAIQETNFYINGEKPVESYTVEKTGGEASARVIINVPKPSTVAVPDAPPAAPAPRPASRPVAAPARPVTPPAKPAVVKVPASAASKPAARAYNDYWVQTGAFTAKVRAEGVKETLASKGITSIIENREVDGKTWYRVRVGPYTSENEANYWLSLVKSIDGFADSQIRQTRSLR